MEEKIIKMSEKGQLVVPKEIREEEDFQASDRFVAVPVEDGIVFKKIELDVKKEFEELHGKVRERFADKGVKKKDVAEAVEWTRSK